MFFFLFPIHTHPPAHVPPMNACTHTTHHPCVMCECAYMVGEVHGWVAGRHLPATHPHTSPSHTPAALTPVPCPCTHPAHACTLPSMHACPPSCTPSHMPSHTPSHPPSTHATHQAHMLPLCLPASHTCMLPTMHAPPHAPPHSCLPTCIPPHMPACSHVPCLHTLPTPAGMAAPSFFSLSFLFFFIYNSHLF